MKKLILILLVFISVFIITSCNKVTKENSTVPAVSSPSAVVHPQTNTKIFNDFAAQLPEFSFKNSVVDNYDQSVSFKFSVKSSKEEYNAYVEALIKAGFVNGTEGSPVVGEGNYKATNSERYMVEAVLVNGTDLTVTVTRP